MIIRKLTTDDLDLLIKLRLDFTLDEGVEFTGGELEDMKARCRDFFLSAMQSDTFVAFAAESNGEILSAAFLTISARPPRRAHQPYLAGTIYNVLTYESHRRKGIATQVLTALLEEAKSVGISSVDLWATEDRQKLYEKLGFYSISCTPMRKEL